MGKSRTEQAPDSISPTQVRYIKLGEGGSWEAECLEKRIVRFGSAPRVLTDLLCVVTVGGKSSQIPSYRREGAEVRQPGSLTRHGYSSRTMVHAPRSG
jgi:hypothetical protein